LIVYVAMLMDMPVNPLRGICLPSLWWFYNTETATR